MDSVLYLDGQREAELRQAFLEKECGAARNSLKIAKRKLDEAIKTVHTFTCLRFSSLTNLPRRLPPKYHYDWKHSTEGVWYGRWWYGTDEFGTEGNWNCPVMSIDECENHAWQHYAAKVYGWLLSMETE